MKNIFKILLLTVMLKVWWPSQIYKFVDYKSGSWIVSSWINVDIYTYAIVINRHKIFKVPMSIINKWEWVEVETEPYKYSSKDLEK